MTERLFGFLPIIKPRGITSRRAVDAVKKLVKPSKVGHTGTLDPLADGVLVVCVGPATRLATFVQQSKKSYLGTFQLGVSSDTNDVESECIALKNAPKLNREQVEAVLPEFSGKISQVPPAYSAIKVKGKRAYQLARRGKEVELKARDIVIHDLQLAEFDYPYFTLSIDCGAGTYIRSLGRDIGQRLGSAAIMSELTRTAVGRFGISNSLPLSKLEPATVLKHLVSPAEFFADLPRAQLNSEQFRKLVHGLTFSASELQLATGLPRVVAVDSENNFLALLQSGGGRSDYRIEINFANLFDRT